MGLSDFFSALLLPFKMLFGDPEHARILRDGRNAVAKVISLGESGSGYVTVNDQPYVKLELEVYEEGKEAYRTSLSTIIPRLAVPQFQPGAMLNIKIDPLDHMKVVLDTSGVQRDKPTVGNTDQAPIEAGKPAMAEVLGIKKTDKEKNGNPVYLVHLEVKPEAEDKYDFEKEIPLPEFALQHFTVGRKYPCTVDGIDRTKIVLDINFS